MTRLLPALLTFAFAASTMQNGPVLLPRAGDPVPTLHTGTKLVIVDVQVTDGYHHPVHGLKANDFAVLENSKAQTIKNFEEHLAPTAAEMAKIPPMPKMPVGTFTNFNPAPSVVTNGPVSVLLIDRINTPMKDQTNMHNELVAYLKKQKPGQRIAIFTLTHQLAMLQGFSDDPEKLLKIADKSLAKGSPLLDDTVEKEMMDPKDGAVKNEMTNFNSFIRDTMLGDRTQRTLEALNELARYLVGIPGRKNLVWMSGSFPLNLLPNTDPAAGMQAFGSVESFEPEFRETISLLSQAQVAVYPIEVEGLWASKCFSAAGGGACGPMDFLAESDQHWETDNTMREIAYQTGGHAFIDDNDIAGAIADSLDDGSNYYTLTYSPTNSEWRGDFRKIQVKLRQQGLEVNYRRGYYADDPLAPPSTWQRLGSGRAVTAPLALPQGYDSMQVAMMHGGPEPAEIVFSAQVAPASTGTEELLAAGNAGSRGLKGPYRRYALTFTANPRDLHLNDLPDGSRHGEIQFVTFIYSRDGKPVNGLRHTVRVNLTKAQYEDALKHNMTFHQQVSIPEKGEYFLRMAMHDLQNDRVGAVEVPVAAVRELAVGMTSGSAPTTPSPK